MARQGKVAQFSLLLLVAALIAWQLDLAESRYLPTRADETDVEVLKELIKTVLMQNREADRYASSLNREVRTANLMGYNRITGAADQLATSRGIRCVLSGIGGEPETGQKVPIGLKATTE